MTAALTDALAALSTLGGLGGLAAVITAWRTGRRQADDVTTIRAAIEPDHGTSLADAVHRIETDLGALRPDLADLRSALGHEVGEIRRAYDHTHADHATRIRRLEDTLLQL